MVANGVWPVIHIISSDSSEPYEDQDSNSIAKSFGRVNFNGENNVSVPRGPSGVGENSNPAPTNSNLETHLLPYKKCMARITVRSSIPFLFRLPTDSEMPRSTTPSSYESESSQSKGRQISLLQEQIDTLSSQLGEIREELKKCREEKKSVFRGIVYERRNQRK